MRFVHTADWQLGMTRTFLSGEAQARYSAARRDAVAGLAALVSETSAQFVVVAGDVFDANQLDPQVISQSLEAVRGIGVPVYLLPGNHDPLDASSVYTSKLFRAECPDNVVVLDAAGVHPVAPGVEIVAAPWRSKRPTADLAAEALGGLGPAHGTIRILVAHGGVDVLDPDPTNPALIRLAALADALAHGAIHYVALGDKHSRTQVGDDGRIWYSGSPEVTNFDHIEADPGHVLMVDIDEADPSGVEVTAHRLGRWRFHLMRRQIDTGADVAELAAALDGLPDKDRTVVRLALTGSLSITDRAALDDVLDRHSRLLAGLHNWERHTDLVVLPEDGEFTDLGLGGFAAAAVEELVELARGGNDEAEDARAALGLLLRLAGRDRGAA